ncbi:MAG: diheme cytochrome c-553 [Ignavibacteria bacterium]|jgi:mono/diheme cytochrome c family protein|nr:diheme cytochrome c-553 [Ignavibacteria bacterium]MCU7504325.1 diheme cytochrome c-553 [Ignavibacteria bacterium]MCU7518170.1 diheme cytochrome c-553 [Ignavibacteria bacterium]
MRKYISMTFVLSAAVLFVFSQMQCSSEKKENSKMSHEELVARGKYLVNYGGCNDCHTPKVMTSQGPLPDSTKLLSGHPASMTIGPIDTAVTATTWLYANMGLTAWAGPWGVSYAANITPDDQTGIGTWTEEIFFKAMREGKYFGTGRPLLPPMPWQSLAGLKDEDLRAIFAYLKSIKPINNKVPDPVPRNMVERTIKARG